MTPYELTLNALTETNPAAAAALAALGPSSAGDPLLGGLGWMDDTDRTDVAKAAMLAHEVLGSDDWEWGDARELSIHMWESGSWRQNASDPRIMKAIEAWTRVSQRLLIKIWDR